MVFVEEESFVSFSNDVYTIQGSAINFYQPVSGKFDTFITGNETCVNYFPEEENIMCVQEGTIHFDAKSSVQKIIFTKETDFTISAINFNDSISRTFVKNLQIMQNSCLILDTIFGTGEINLSANATMTIATVNDETMFNVGYTFYGGIKNGASLEINTIKNRATINVYGKFNTIKASNATVMLMDSSMHNTIIGNNNNVICHETSMNNTILGDNLRIEDSGINNSTGAAPSKDSPASSGKFGDITIKESSIIAPAPINLSQVIISDTSQSTSNDSGAIVALGGIGVGKNAYIGGNAIITGTLRVGASFISGNNTGDQTIILANEVSGSGTGTINVTINNASVITKVLTGFVANVGIVTNTDTILVAFQKLAGAAAIGISGDGSSGRVPFFNGTRTITSSSLFNYSAAQGLTIANNTTSTSATSGALVVTGGAGINGNLFIGGNLNVAGTITFSNISAFTLTGDVTGSGNNTITTAISNTVITGKLLTNFSQKTGTISSADSILSGIEKISGNVSLAITGDGVATRVPFYNATRTIGNSANFTFDSTNNELFSSIVRANDGIYTNATCTTLNGTSNQDILVCNNMALAVSPTNDNHLVTKNYVDSKITTFYYPKLEDESRLNTTTMTADAHMQAQISVGIYKIYGIVVPWANTNAPGIRMALEIMGTATVETIRITYVRYNSNSGSLQVRTQNTVGNAGSTMTINSNDNLTNIIFEGIICITEVSDNPLLAFEWAQSSASTTVATTLKRGSFMEITKLA